MAHIGLPGLKASPAFGLIKEGDVIKKVNDEELSVFNGLAEAVSVYKPGNKIELLILRSGKEERVSVILK